MRTFIVVLSLLCLGGCEIYIESAPVYDGHGHETEHCYEPLPYDHAAEWVDEFYDHHGEYEGECAMWYVGYGEYEEWCNWTDYCDGWEHVATYY